MIKFHPNKKALVKDKYFKSLNHRCKGFIKISSGQQISKGYKPDVVLKNNEDFIILECETNTSRKGFVGGMIKAAKYLSDEKKGRLVFIIEEKSNISANQIKEHLFQYFEWIRDKSNLLSVHVILDTNYSSNGNTLELYSKEFEKHSKAIT